MKLIRIDEISFSRNNRIYNVKKQILRYASDRMNDT